MFQAIHRQVARRQGAGVSGWSLISRIVLGWLFIDSGWQKWHSMPQIIAYFTDLGIPAPALQAPMVASIELGCGLLLLSGLFTRLAALPLMGTMAVALLTAKRGDVHGFADLIGCIEFIYLLLLGWLVACGAGRLSLDDLLLRRSMRK